MASRAMIAVSVLSAAVNAGVLQLARAGAFDERVHCVRGDVALGRPLPSGGSPRFCPTYSL